jgi:predicted metal-dependent hydrolase
VANKKVIPWELPNGKMIDITWRTSWRSRSVRLSVRGQTVNISSPPLLPQIFLKKYLTDQSAWLAAHIQPTQKKSSTLLYLGQEYQLVYHQPGSAQSAHHEPIQITDNMMHVFPVQATSASIHRLLERWLQGRAAATATPLLQVQAQSMGLSVPTLKFKETKSRWGSCSSMGAITLNWRLIHAPLAVIRYVIVHELSHRVHLNHSKKFWELVELHDPEFRVHRGWLKRHGHECATPEINIG